ncbi:hypothetical protein QM012_008722 [Aureobasidium pullulans]|uniref:SRR1-like domain-containing protein n=1 Tax=Aureobasidium pullulans TaxID=5580 RepID=A0ABR0THG0_AURPU
MAPTAVGKADGRGRMVFEQGCLRRIGQSESVMGKPSEERLAAGHVYGSGRYGYGTTLRPNLKHADGLKLYAQEPRFTSLDKDFLHTLGVTVLEPPQAEELTDQSTLIFIPCLEWLLELPFMLVAVKSQLYVSSSMHWIIDEAERSRYRLVADVKNDTLVLKQCDDAIAAAKAVLDTHHQNKMPEADFADGHSLALTVYTLQLSDED